MLENALKRLVGHSAVYALAPAFGSVVGFVLMPLVTRFIGSVDNYGVKEWFEVTVALAVQVLGVNLLHGMTRFYSDYEAEEDRAKLVTTSLVLVTVTGGAAALLGLALATPLSRAFFGTEEQGIVLRALAGIVLFQLVGQVGLRYLQLLERSGTYVAIFSGKLLLEVALKVVFLVALHLETMGVIYPVLVGEALLAGSTAVTLARRLGLRFSRDMARRLVRYSYPLVVSGIFAMALHQADRYVVQVRLGEYELGLYGLAYKLGAAVNAFLLTGFGMIWFPYVFSLRAEGDVRFVCRKVLTWFGVAATFATLALALFGRELVGVMDPMFRDAHRAVGVVAFGYLFWGLYQVVHTPFYLRERTGLSSVLVALAALLNVGATVWAVGRFGWTGAAWTTLATFAVLAGGAYLVAQRIYPVPYELARMAAILAVGAGLYGVGRLLPEETRATILGAKAGLLLAFPGILYLLGIPSAEEKEGIKRILGRVD